MSNRIHILGCNIDRLTMDQTIQKVENIIAKREPMQHVVVNAAKIVMMHEDPKLRDIINHCAIINADGQSIVWASRLLKQPLPERVTGIDLMLKLVELSAVKGYRLFFFGAKEEVVSRVVKTLKKKYPSLQIAGYRNGYFKPEDNDDIVEQINASNADILFVGFSSPKKEYWLAQNLLKLNVPFCMGVGGSFDVIAGVRKRAPLWMQKIGLEWFFRFIQEPRRMWRRVFLMNAKFLWLLLKEMLKQ